MNKENIETITPDELAKMRALESLRGEMWIKEKQMNMTIW